jgi:hypothetical protein
MTETEHLIRQAAREIGITQWSEMTATADVDIPGTYRVEFKNRRGDGTTINIKMDAGFKTIHAQLKAAWKGTTDGTKTSS